MPASASDGAALAKTYRRKIFAALFWGNFVATLPSVIALATGTGQDLDPRHAVQHAVVTLTADLIYLALFWSTTAFYVRKLARPLDDWLGGARPAEDHDRTFLNSLPRRVAIWSLVWWAGALIWGPILGGFVFRSIPLLILVIWTISMVLPASFIGPALAYFLMERALRPLIGLANRGSPVQRSNRFGALPRLVLAFAAGLSPLPALCLSLIGLHERERAAFASALWPEVLVVVLGAMVLAVVVARAVTEPVDEIRRGFGRLKAGDLDVDIEVNEPGEIGELQAGFNDMVSGLREREQMRDVFVRLVGRDVAQHALEHSSELTADVREATAMFVDVVGSTPLAESSSPQDYLTTLNAFYDLVVAAVEQSGGLVNQFQGDGALCIFGAPLDQPDHAVRALRAARELRVALDDFALTSGVQAVIGVSTGDVVAGHVGTSDRYEFTVVGDAVNEAKRLAEQAKNADGKVLVSDATIRSAQGEVANWREEAVLQLRGRSGETVAFAPTRESDPRNAPTA